MKVAIIHNHQTQSVELARELKILIEQAGIQLDYQEPEIVLSIGGDGTLLSAFHQYSECLDKVRFVGIHTGHLGFYTDWRSHELDELVASLLEDTGKCETYPLLELVITFHGRPETKKFLALNESIVRRMKRTMVADVYIKGEFFERFRGDGLAVATPTGSTAYNKSVGGAVLHPHIRALQLTEIASINNRVFRSLGSALVIPNDEWIEIQLEEAEDYLLTVDQLNLNSRSIATLRYKIANERIRFAAFRHMNFWRRIKDAFISDD